MAREGHVDTATAQDAGDTLTLPGGTGGTYGPLPEPTKAGYSFGGWFTGPDGTGTRITRHSPVRAGNLTVYARWVTPALHFGQAGCSSIDVGPFEPICTRPEIGGSEPLTLNIPVPTYAPIVPPQECVCFEFDQGKSTVDVTPDCVDGKIEFTLDIKPADDCCSGKYKIEPTVALALPCVPFKAADYDGTTPLINVTNQSGDEARGVDGGVTSLELVKNCCDVYPTIDIALPDCLKYYDKSSYVDAEDNPVPQITYCAYNPVTKKAEQKNWTLIEMVEDPEHCNTYPVVRPLTIPCCALDDFDQTVERSLGVNVADGTENGSIKITLKQVECKPTIDVAVSKIRIPRPVVNVVGAGVGSGGSVLQDSDGNLFTHGGFGIDDGSKTTWYGGGIGNRADDEEQATVYSRGPAMRNNEPGVPSLESVKIPCYMMDDKTWQLTNATGANGVATLATSKWRSSRAQTNAAGKVVTDERGYAVEMKTPPGGSTDQGGDSSDPVEPAYQFGNLDMVMPSGFQWHTRGVAAVLSEFMWNAGGTLSALDETGTAVLLSPAPSVWGEYTPAAGQAADPVARARSGQNASGLDIEYGGTGSPLSGLVVNTGNGMRIFGLADGRTTDAEITEIAETAFGDEADTTALNRIGELEIYAHDGDFAFGSGADAGKLLLNDGKNASDNEEEPNSARTNDDSLFGCVSTYARATHGGDYTMPVVTSMYYYDDDFGMWTQYDDGSYTNMLPDGSILDALQDATDAVTNADDKAAHLAAMDWDILADMAQRTDALRDTVLALSDAVALISEAYTQMGLLVCSLRLVNMHVGKAGIITGIDVDDTGENVPRRAPQIKPTPGSTP